MKLSLVIPCLNAASTITAQLEALANQDYSESWEVIISDNGSTDKTLEIVNQYKSQLPALNIVDSSDRRGAAHARNVGATVARGEVLLFCDADDEVAPGWMTAMAKALSKYDFVASYVDLEKLNSPYILKKKTCAIVALFFTSIIFLLRLAGGWGLSVRFTMLLVALINLCFAYKTLITVGGFSRWASGFRMFLMPLFTIVILTD